MNENEKVEAQQENTSENSAVATDNSQPEEASGATEDQESGAEDIAAEEEAQSAEIVDDVEDEDDEVDEDEEMSAEDFEALLKASEDRTLMRVSAGQKATGHVVSISGDVAYVDIGMRSEAVLSLDNKDDQRLANLQEGDEIDVYVANPSGQVTLSLDPIMGKGDFSVLEDAYNDGNTVEGKVSSVIKGGYEVNVAGVRCFCPHSQISLRGVDDPTEMVGNKYEFRVLEAQARGRNVVLSRRALLREKVEKQMAKTRELLVPGAVLKGTVRDIQSFGAFVDLGGIQGLLHISELSYQNVNKVEDVVNIGEELEVKLLDVTTDRRGKDRISLSLKALQPNPWENLNFDEGQMITGTVARKSKFGVFITLAPAVDGLLPRRMMKKAGQEVHMDSFEEGQELEVEVVEINHQDRKIALALPGWDESLKSDLHEGDLLQAEVVKILPVGVLVKGVEDPARGLLHKRHLKQNSMKQIVDAYPVGSVHTLMLSEVDEQGRYNFVLPQSEENVDQGTIKEFTDGDGLGHNPFANFFKEQQ